MTRLQKFESILQPRRVFVMIHPPFENVLESKCFPRQRGTMNILLIVCRKRFQRIVFSSLFEQKTAYFPPLAGVGCTIKLNTQFGVDKAE